MKFALWHKKTIKTLGPVSDLSLYLRTLVFSLLIFGLTYSYTAWLKLPSVLNKSVADTSIILIGLSMLLSGVCYFWNFFDTKIVYRKHLGLVGFAYGIIHMVLSSKAFLSVFSEATWAKGVPWAALTGLIAAAIFLIMTISSNQYSAIHLGGRVWRMVLRTGYIAILFVMSHVLLLKFNRWTTWYNDGMTSPPSLSLIVTVFMACVILMRLALWWALKSKQSK